MRDMKILYSTPQRHLDLYVSLVPMQVARLNVYLQLLMPCSTCVLCSPNIQSTATGNCTQHASQSY